MKLCSWQVGATQPLFLIAGPCIIESAELTLEIATTLRDIIVSKTASFACFCSVQLIKSATQQWRLV